MPDRLTDPHGRLPSSDRLSEPIPPTDESFPTTGSDTASAFPPPPPGDVPPLGTLPAGPPSAPGSSATVPFPVLPGYELLEELGRGGMGVVYQARQTLLNRPVALKVILTGAHASAEDRVRFLAEAEAIGALNHPGIVQVYECGTHDGQPYLSLELCPGGTLAARLRDSPLPPKQAAALVEQLARAVQAAHERGIIHRDLKPANVLFAADGTMKIADFGLAKRVEGGGGPTQTGDILGTPSYMAPEQAGGTKGVGPPVDVYALGAILYECLTGRPPFRAATPVETLLQVRESEPVSVRSLNPQVPADLGTVCHQCLQKEPHKRYASAAALAEDLRRFRAGEPIAARPTRRLERVWRWCRRNPSVAGLAAAAVLALAAGAGVAGWQYARTVAALEREEAVNYANRVRLAASYVREVQPDRADEQLDGCPPARRGWEWHFLRRLCRPPVAALSGHTEAVQAVAYAPDGRQVATGARDGTARLWEAATGRERAVLRGHAGWVKSVAYRGDGRVLATAGEDETVILWDPATGQELRRLPGAGGQVAFAPAGPRLATARRDRRVVLWDVEAGRELWSAQPFPEPIGGLAFHPGGTVIAVTSAVLAKAVVFDAATGREVARTVFQDLGISAASARVPTRAVFSPDGGSFYLGVNGRVWEIDAQTGHRRRPIVGLPFINSGLAIRPDGHRLAVANSYGRLRQIDLDTGLHRSAPRQHVGIVPDLAYSPDGRFLAVPRGRAVTLEPAQGPGALAYRSVPGRGLDTQLNRLLAFSPDGRWLATINRTGARETLFCWDVADGRLLHEIETDATAVDNSLVLFGLGGRCLYAQLRRPGLGAAALQVEDMAARQHLWALPAQGGHADLYEPMTVSPDGMRFAWADADGTIEVRDLATAGTPVWSTRLEAQKLVTSLHFSPDGRHLAAAGEAQDIFLLDASSGQLLRTIPGQHQWVSWVRFSPDGRRLVVAADNGIRVYVAASGRALRDLSGHQDHVLQAHFSPDGRRLASVGMDGVAKVWDADSGHELLTLTDPAGRLHGVAFSPDGQLLAAACSDGSVKLYDGTPLPEDGP